MTSRFFAWALVKDRRDFAPPTSPAFPKPLNGRSLMVKRAVDVVLSSLSLFFLLPVFILIALLIKATSRGPVLFTQARAGYHDEPFHMLKFRSMRDGVAPFLDENGKEKQASKKDPRVTPFGRFLRRTSLDEIPQLINVLRGEMSLVGPRPHVPSHNRYYEEMIDRYASRHKMRPGMTGWAQLNGLRGETDTVDKMARRVACDIWYAENWSLLLDMRILLLTPLVVLFQRGAY
ncbi:MAG: hypothetical protein COY40_00160 [Alphaproteobacteria bacterium CG_4_10_14_0_8_um_filter_53_9]|nr:MAG: hypothetical protein COY40_00160 [Alphaproteobacteria bacterium CG_4_10_14_0_8_um_filter_53_9]